MAQPTFQPAPGHGTRDEIYDFVIIGSGFGGSVSALRLTEKGYRVLLIEKGRRFDAQDFPKTNWDLKRWFWMPQAGLRGLFQMSFFPHVTIVHGVGYGGGSLVYANTLPIPRDDFFRAASWGKLADWKNELEPHYATARRMLGATENKHLGVLDDVVRQVGADIGRPAEDWQPTHVAVYFGQPGKTVPDPYFGGEGPERTGCIFCGGCMIGCRHGAKNTLDRNYLYLAERRGLQVETETEVTAVRPMTGPEPGYRLEVLAGSDHSRRTPAVFRGRRVIFAGGVMGTVDLLLRMKEDPGGLPRLSERVGDFVRTNSEALIGITTERRDIDLSKGIAISSILNTDAHSHLEPCRYSEGSGFWRLMTVPHVTAGSFLGRMAQLAGNVLRDPLGLIRWATVPDHAKYSTILLYMRTLEGYIRFRRGRSYTTGFQTGLTTELGEGPAPTASIPEATDLAHRIADRLQGYVTSLLTETVMGVPSTAHILGGACMGETGADGVIDAQHRVHGYDGLYVVDGSAVSANPGVNPSLTITAMAERAMQQIPAKS